VSGASADSTGMKTTPGFRAAAIEEEFRMVEKMIPQ